MNLTGITEYEEVIQKHFLDSLSLIRVIPTLADPDHQPPGRGVGPNIGRVGIDQAFKETEHGKTPAKGSDVRYSPAGRQGKPRQARS